MMVFYIFINEYLNNVTISAEDINIPSYVLGSDICELHSLILVTNKYIYYAHKEDIIALSTKDHSLVSDDYMAEVLYSESCDNIREENEEEKLLWGIIP